MSHSRLGTSSGLYVISAYWEILLQIVIFFIIFYLLVASNLFYFFVKAVFGRIFLLLWTKWSQLFSF